MYNCLHAKTPKQKKVSLIVFPREKNRTTTIRLKPSPSLLRSEMLLNY